MPVSRPAAGRQAVGVSWQVRREMVGVPVTYINEAVSPHCLRHAHDSHAIDPGATLPEVQATLAMPAYRPRVAICTRGLTPRGRLDLGVFLR